VVGSSELKIHIEFDGLYLEQNVQVTDIKSNSMARGCEGAIAPKNATEVSSTKTYLKQTAGEVEIQWCLLAIPCGGTEKQAFMAGSQKFTGFSTKRFSQHITIPFNFDADDWEAFRELPKILKDESTQVFLRLSRVDNITSSGKVFYLGYSAPEGDGWKNMASYTLAADTLVIDGVDVPVTNILDDDQDPEFGSTGGSFGSVTCPTTPGGGGTDPDPAACNCSGTNIGTGREIFKRKTDEGVFEFRTIQPGQNITITQGDNELTIEAVIGGSTGGKVTLDPIVPVPSLSISGLFTKTYTAGTVNNLPVFVAGSTLTDNTVTVVLTRDQGTGVISTTTDVLGVTSTIAEGSFTVSGPVDDVNQILADLKYSSEDGEQGDVRISGKITDSAGTSKKACQDAVLVSPTVKSVGREAYVTGQLTGNSGQIRIKANGLYIHDGWVSFNLDIPTTSNDLVDAINNSTTTPDYSATWDTATQKITINATKALGDDANGWDLSYDTTGTLAWSGGSHLNGGVKKDETFFDSLGGFLSDKNLWANIAGGTAGGLLSWWLMPDAATQSVSFPTVNLGLTGEYEKSVAYLYRGKKVKIPNVFNPTTRTYSGAWDGVTFAADEAWTDDPAWCLRDYLTNSNFGTGEILRLSSTDLAVLDQDLYQCSLRNCEVVGDGKGGTQTRYTINTVIQANMTKWEAIQAIASTMHAKVVWHHGQIRVTQDRPDDVRFVFNNCNVQDGVFSWSGGSASTSYSVVNVIWNNPELYYKQDVVVAQDNDLVDYYGTRTLDEIAFGCTRKAQAIRHGLWVLQTDKTEPQQVDFVAGWEAWDMMPGDIVAIEDQYKSRNPMNNRFTTVSGQPQRIRLSEEVTFTFPDTYKVRFRRADGTTVQATVTGIRDASGVALAMSGTKTGVQYIDLDTSVGTISEWPVVNITGTGAGKDEKLFRVIKVSEDKFGAFGVTAVRYYADKYDYIDDADNYVIE
jgi:hypothetical protein